MVTIWVCDDSRKMAMLTARFIEKELIRRGEKYRLELFFSGNELLDVFLKDKFTPDLLFIAVKMKETDGIKIGEYFKRFYCRTLIIYMSAYEEALIGAINSRPFACINKGQLDKEIPYFIDKALLRKGLSKKGDVYFKVGNMQHELSEEKIKYLLCLNKKTLVYIEEQYFETRLALKTLLESLSESFVLISRGVVVNMDFIFHVKGKEITMSDGQFFVCSKSRYSKFKLLWKEYTCIKNKD